MDPVTLGALVGGALVSIGGAMMALPALGFTAAGVAAGSVAAAIQSIIGNVGAGTIFAALQSAGVIGFASSTLAAIGAAGAGIAAAFMSWF